MLLELGERRYDLAERPLVMGILNRTPDSFFDGGEYWGFDHFLRKAEQLAGEGADILDVGGVKAGPGSEVTADEEAERVVPAIEALASRFDVPLSVDTWRASVAEAAYAAGAVLGNDISGFADPDYLLVAAEARAAVVACHVRLAPRYADPDPVYGDLHGEVRSYLAERASWAAGAGLGRSRVLLDAGLDLGKTPAMSAELLRRSDHLAEVGYPVLLSASNKGFLGWLCRTEVGERPRRQHRRTRCGSHRRLRGDPCARRARHAPRSWRPPPSCDGTAGTSSDGDGAVGPGAAPPGPAGIRRARWR